MSAPIRRIASLALIFFSAVPHAAESPDPAAQNVIERYSLQEAEVPVKERAGWHKPKRILVGGFASEILGAPPKEGPGSPNLAACQRLLLQVDNLRYCMISRIS